ncbi:MAG: hypothetical protein H6638_12550 [Ardenticatenales bacterium]|nr:hypothetical protein [Ardenticatenales bacterium]
MSDFYSTLEETAPDRDRWYWFNRRRYTIGTAQLTISGAIRRTLVAGLLLFAIYIAVFDTTRTEALAAATAIVALFGGGLVTGRLLVHKFGATFALPYSDSCWEMPDETQGPTVIMALAGPLTNLLVP